MAKTNNNNRRTGSWNCSSSTCRNAGRVLQYIYCTFEGETLIHVKKPWVCFQYAGVRNWKHLVNSQTLPPFYLNINSTGKQFPGLCAVTSPFNCWPFRLFEIDLKKARKKKKKEAVVVFVWLVTKLRSQFKVMSFHISLESLFHFVFYSDFSCWGRWGLSRLALDKGGDTPRRNPPSFAWPHRKKNQTPTGQIKVANTPQRTA